MACIFHKMPYVFSYVMTGGGILIRITALFKAWRMKNIRENMMSEPWKNAVSVWHTDILRMRFKKYGFICSRGLLSPARQTVPAALYAFCSVAGMRLLFHVIPFVVVVVRVVVIGI